VRLARLFENLFRNSVEHGSRPEGDGVSVCVGTLPGGFYVEDDGVGISPGERGHVLEFGYSTTEDGTGIGLGIVEDVATAHGWTVSITESASGGARFEFTDVV
jgi:signal transduction histidine kinase